jgi:hypothetical protein
MATQPCDRTVRKIVEADAVILDLGAGNQVASGNCRATKGSTQGDQGDNH